jgi:RNA-binding protein
MDAGFIIEGMALSEKQLKFLRGKAHPLKPIIMIGKTGLSASVTAETERALHDHELIKVRVRTADRAARDALLGELIQQTHSELVTRIGHVAVLYRAHPKLPRLVIPGT